MAQLSLTARIREKKGKEAAKKLRKNNEFPAIFYGPKSEPILLVVKYSAIRQVMKKSSGENVIIGLQIEREKGTEVKTVMLKEIQMDPIKDLILHADFYEVSMDQEVTVNIPIHLLNTPIGVTNGGILQHIRRELAVTCLPADLLEHLDVDVSSLDIGDSIHVKDIQVPSAVTPLDEGHLTVAVVAAPTVTVEEAEEEEVEAEGVEAEAEETKTEGTEES